MKNIKKGKKQREKKKKLMSYPQVMVVGVVKWLSIGHLRLVINKMKNKVKEISITRENDDANQINEGEGGQDSQEGPNWDDSKESSENNYEVMAEEVEALHAQDETDSQGSWHLYGIFSTIK